MKHILSISEALSTEKKYAILFTDVKGSSELWTSSNTEMFKTLDKHQKLMTKITTDNNGLVIKTIGDAFMCRFDDLSTAIQVAIDIQNDEPLKVKNKPFLLRIGIAYGEVIEKSMEIQGHKMIDYFGNTVNTASRMESKVSEVGGFAFTSIGKLPDEKEIKKLIENLKVKTINFAEDCKIDFKRSSRLLTESHNIQCKSIEDLKGVKPTVTYSCQ